MFWYYIMLVNSIFIVSLYIPGNITLRAVESTPDYMINILMDRNYLPKLVKIYYK